MPVVVRYVISVNTLRTGRLKLWFRLDSAAVRKSPPDREVCVTKSRSRRVFHGVYVVQVFPGFRLSMVTLGDADVHEEIMLPGHCFMMNWNLAVRDIGACGCKETRNSAGCPIMLPRCGICSPSTPDEEMNIWKITPTDAALAISTSRIVKQS